ncbi:hypothetical protein BDV95DRAFT_628754 [Massariosphaeria phaeospora]|uniref:Major facilitator superfamily (MFS) profile domain-containing protein n=1 Tax=Massariosphaeria phaeospora TaxID=100035 RepID=A0A7C8M9V0_9PLEO|nr:hypothetical protein BDV95DRAFT_628754 [Massariosphaeria phaeospora]
MSSIIIEKECIAVYGESIRRSATITTSSTSCQILLDTPPSPSVAAAANRAEQSMTLREGIRLYPKAIMWSVLLSTALVMEGFDTVLLPNLYAYDPFKRHFGHHLRDGSYELTARWQTTLSNGALSGQILGLFIAGSLSESIGYRRTLMGALGSVVVFIFVVFFSERKEVLLVGEILLGIPWGVFQTLTTTYAAEVCPVALRAYLTTYVNACWVFGQLLASIVLRVMVSRNDKWGYKIPFALQWFWPIPLAAFVYLAPESPWWLVRKNRISDAKRALRRLRTRANDMDELSFESSIEGTLEIMRNTNEKETEMLKGSSYLDCFRGTDRRRTEIACACWLVQILCGSTFMGYSTYFYGQAGVPSHHAFTLSLVQFVLGLLGVGCSWALMTRFGRRTLYLSGQVCLFVFVLAIGILSLIPTASFPNAKWGIASLLLIFTMVYDATVGPICYSLVSEIPSTRLRSKTIVLARNCYNVAGILTNITTPLMLNPTAWNWGAGSGFFWAGTAALGLVWSWFRLPEPKGRTYAELDELFEKGVGARRFRHTQVEVHRSQMMEAQEGTETLDHPLRQEDHRVLEDVYVDLLSSSLTAISPHFRARHDVESAGDVQSTVDRAPATPEPSTDV